MIMIIDLPWNTFYFSDLNFRQKPSFLEFYSYIFHFQTLLSGPLVFYNDYIEFTDGTNIKKHHSKNGFIKLNPFVRTWELSAALNY